jgi:7,8-dihydropterin-6-yl-methyl-4-(beta-D-ribofuranosyl)aminobenzene 5'-phosphate synthase
MTRTKITILCENRTCISQGVTGEHGFSALVEKNGEKLLLDTGQGLSLIPNAKALGIPLSDISQIVLSHGHYDHTGGLAVLPRQENQIPIYTHTDIFNEKYAIVKDSAGKDIYKFIGIRQKQEKLEAALNARFIFKTKFTKISDQIFFSGEIPRVTDFEKSDSRLVIKENNQYLPDPLIDDSSILIVTDSGPVVLSGCAHAGIINVMEHFSKQAGYDHFYAVIGGTHLGFLNSPDQLEKTMDAFDRYGVKHVAVSHCTGNKAAAACYTRFKDRFAFANAGWTIKC